MRLSQFRASELSLADSWRSSVTCGENSTETHGFGGKHANETYCRLGKEASYTTIGPIPHMEFLNTFMHRDAILESHPMPRKVPGNAFAKLRYAKKECDSYLPLVCITLHLPSHQLQI